MLQFINVYKIVYRKFWVYYHNGRLTAVAINSYNVKIYSLVILPDYCSNQFDGNEQVNMPSVAILLIDNNTNETDHVLMQIYSSKTRKSVIPQGLYTASYNRHGLELVYVYHDEMTSSTKGLKIIGDKNVPAGKLSFVISNESIELAKNFIYDTRPTFTSFMRPSEEAINTDDAFMHNRPPSTDDHTLIRIENKILIKRRNVIFNCYFGNGNTNDSEFFWLNNWLPLTMIVYKPQEKDEEDRDAFTMLWDDAGFQYRHFIDFKQF
jgi:hypothetical protein